MAGVFPSEATVYISAVDTVASAVASSDAIKGEVTNWSLSGGSQEIEVVHAIGGDIGKEMPRDQYEVSFDLVVQNTATSTLDRWDVFSYGTGLSSATEGDAKSMFLDFATGSFKKVLAMNNCRSVTWDRDLDAEDMYKGTMTFKFSAIDELGLANFKTESVSTGSDYTIDWS